MRLRLWGSTQSTYSFFLPPLSEFGRIHTDYMDFSSKWRKQHHAVGGSLVTCSLPRSRDLLDQLQVLQQKISNLNYKDWNDNFPNLSKKTFLFAQDLK
ncbi:hypothetical protein C0J52_20997 [Blattella germanica]|nr:hypothetical protein C0J52_20997 [Blattella germanica]